MALTPEGTPYVESTDLVANYPAASLSLANRVDLVGVLPFATSAARATAIPSPTDGQYSYLQDSNSTEFWNGSAWVAAGTAPGLVHINTTTLTGASVSINNVFSATYDNYEILLYSTADTGLQARLRVGGTDNTSSNYAWQQAFADNTTFIGERQTAVTSFRVSNQNASAMTVPSKLTFYDPAKAAVTQFLGSNVRVITTPVLISVGGAHNVATAYDGITFFVSSGNMSGTVRIYGYKNS